MLPKGSRGRQITYQEEKKVRDTNYILRLIQDIVTVLPFRGKRVYLNVLLILGFWIKLCVIVFSTHLFVVSVSISSHHDSAHVGDLHL